jgi:hypothetical protein
MLQKFLEKILDLWDKRALVPQFEALENIPYIWLLRSHINFMLKIQHILN